MNQLTSLKTAVLSSTSAASILSFTTDVAAFLKGIVKKALVIVMIGVVVLSPAQAHAFNLGKAINRGVINIGKSVEKGAHDAGRSIQTAAQQTGHAVETATHDTGNAVQTATQQTGKAIEVAAHDAGHSVERATSDAGHAIEIATHQTGKAIEKATQQTGKAIEKGAHDVGHYIEEHPLEAALMLAMVAGGGYLVAFQNFDLIVQGVTIAKGGAWVGVAGYSASGLATAGLAASASTMASPPPVGEIETRTSGQPPVGPDGGVRIQATVGPTAGQLGSALAFPSKGLPGLRDQPILPKTRTTTSVAQAAQRQHALSDFDARIKVGKDTLDWIERDRVLENFDAKAHPVASPAELKLFDAITTVMGIPDSPADEAAKEQRQERKNPLGRILDAALDEWRTSNNPEEVWTAMQAALLVMVVEPTKLGDGQAAARDHQVKLLGEKLEEFGRKRFVQEMVTSKGPSLPPAPIQGPVIKPL